MRVKNKIAILTDTNSGLSPEQADAHGMHEIIEALKLDRETRFADQKVAIRAAYSGDEKLGEVWRQELQAAFPDLLIEKDSLSLSIACHTGDGALGVGLIRDIWHKKGCAF